MPRKGQYYGQLADQICLPDPIDKIGLYMARVAGVRVC